MATETKTFYPGAYDRSVSQLVSTVVENESTVVGKGANNLSYALINASRNGVASVYWPFDVSSIPSNAIIDSVVCKVKAYLPLMTSDAHLQMRSGTTAKGAEVTIPSTNSAQTFTIKDGTWTRAELKHVYLETYLAVAAARSVYFYGADLTVTYTYQSEKFMLKLGGAWHDIARVFKKVSGIWVEQTDLANVIGENVRYQNGGEVISPAAVTITGSGNATYCYATINGTKYSGAASNIEVMPGDVITFGVYGRSSTYYGRVTIDGTQALNVTNQTTQTYNWTVPDGVKTISISMAYTSTSTQRNGRITVTTNLSGGSGGDSNLITFTNGGTSYQAEEGMTWEEWINSDYNGGVYTISDDNRPSHVSNRTYVFKYVGTNDVIFYVDEVIDPNYEYGARR